MVYEVLVRGVHDAQRGLQRRHVALAPPDVRVQRRAALAQLCTLRRELTWNFVNTVLSTIAEAAMSRP